eukprot:8127310-Ditylum_brightwellii.AAC.1
MEQVNSFASKKSISFQLGKATVYVYLHLTTGMMTVERAFRFMTIKLVLEDAYLSGKTSLQLLGDLTSTTFFIIAMQEQYIQHAIQFVQKPNQFTVRS